MSEREAPTPREHQIQAGVPVARCIHCGYPSGWVGGATRTCEEYLSRTQGASMSEQESLTADPDPDGSGAVWSAILTLSKAGVIAAGWTRGLDVWPHRRVTEAALTGLVLRVRQYPERELAALRAHVEKLEAENARLTQRFLDDAHEGIRAQATEITRLEGEVASLREALERIAATSRYPDPTDAANESIQVARAALSPEP